MSKELEIEENSNNNYVINGERIYAPNIGTAIRRYVARFGTGSNVIMGGKNLCQKKETL